MMRLPMVSAFKSRRLHLGVCGSIAAYKAVEIMRLLQKAGIEVSVTLTEAAERFITPLTFASLGADPVYTQMFEQGDETSIFGHLQPGRTAHALLIAPATATTLARIAGGFADDMLSAQVLSFPGPLVIAPAMNPNMWDNAATQENVRRLQARGATFVFPESGAVACGDTGQGKLAEPLAIAFAAAKALVPQDFSGKKVLVTLGPTAEAWDGVRLWTNRSTGKMGAALVAAACLRGAEVHAVAGPGVPALPDGCHRYDVTSAKEMLAAASDIWPQMTHGLFAAAVGDFYPEPFGAEKFKKTDAVDGFSISFKQNPDILATLGQSKGQRGILGFAAESNNLEESARGKLVRKNADIIAGNLIGQEGMGFAASTNTMFVCDKNGREEHWPSLAKDEVAWRLLDWLLTL